MIFDYSLAALVAAGLLVYLIFALLRPERFSSAQKSVLFVCQHSCTGLLTVTRVGEEDARISRPPQTGVTG